MVVALAVNCYQMEPVAAVVAALAVFIRNQVNGLLLKTEVLVKKENIIGRQAHNGGNGGDLGGGSENVLVQPIGCFKGGQGSKAGGIGWDENLSPTLSAADSGSNRTPTLMQNMQVRRLLPIECERL